jgi:omega-amidase
MSTLNVTIVQADLHWHDASANRLTIGQMLEELTDTTDLIVLPEMFTTGFTMDAPAQAETMNGASVNWMSQLAHEKNASVCGSLIIEENGEYFNRFICVSPAGGIVEYDKRHLFRLADEHKHFSPGSNFVTFEINGWRICPMICYDLRFPAWSRNRNDYDLLLYVANWPNRRHLAWETLLRARAIENLSYVAGVNRTGVDGNELPYDGGSAIIDFLGQDVENLGKAVGLTTATLDLDKLNVFRERFAFDKDADIFSIDARDEN